MKKPTALDPTDASIAEEHQARLRQAIDDSSLLIAFLSTSKREIKPETITALVNAQAAYREDPKLNAKEEAAFWSAFSSATTAAQPATVDGIRDVALNRSLGFFGWMAKFPWIALPSVFALAIYLLVQIHVVSGTTILGRFDATVSSLGEASQAMPPDAAKIGILTKDLSRLTGLLDRWNQCPFYPVNIICLAGGESNAVPAIGSTDSNAAALKAQIWLNTLNSYVLPLILGLLGACTQVLRSIARRIVNQSMNTMFLPAYYVRLVLGIIVGATIGLFIIPSAEGDTSPLSFFATLPLLTTAFLAGYAVEIFFALLDRVIGDARSYITGKSEDGGGATTRS